MNPIKLPLNTYNRTQPFYRRDKKQDHFLEIGLLEPYPSFETSMEGLPDVLTVEDYPELLIPASPQGERRRYESLRQEAYLNSFRMVDPLKLEFAYHTSMG